MNRQLSYGRNLKSTSLFVENRRNITSLTLS